MKPDLRGDQEKDQPSQDTRRFQYASNGSSQKKVLTLTESARKVLTCPNLHQNNGSSNKVTTQDVRKSTANKKQTSKNNATVVEDDVDYDVDYEDEFISDNDDAKDEDYIDQEEEDEDDECFLENDQDDAEIFRLGYLQQRYILLKFGD
jgi:hypothetical protein